MQSFLPYPDFSQSARCLDRLRLGKQRVEVYQILRTLNGETKGWKNHPAVRMWSGHIPHLAGYGLAMCREWKARGYQDNLSEKIAQYAYHDNPATLPSWLGNKEFHKSHQSNLLRKDPEWYSKFRWNVPDDLPYVWPVERV